MPIIICKFGELLNRHDWGFLISLHVHLKRNSINFSECFSLPRPISKSNQTLKSIIQVFMCCCVHVCSTVDLVLSGLHLQDIVPQNFVWVEAWLGTDCTVINSWMIRNQYSLSTTRWRLLLSAYFNYSAPIISCCKNTAVH